VRQTWRWGGQDVGAQRTGGDAQRMGTWLWGNLEGTGAHHLAAASVNLARQLGSSRRPLNKITAHPDIWRPRRVCERKLAKALQRPWSDTPVRCLSGTGANLRALCKLPSLAGHAAHATYAPNGRLISPHQLHNMTSRYEMVGTGRHRVDGNGTKSRANCAFVVVRYFICVVSNNVWKDGGKKALSR